MDFFSLNSRRTSAQLKKMVPLWANNRKLNSGCDCLAGDFHFQERVSEYFWISISL